MKATPKEIANIRAKGLIFADLVKLHKIWQLQLKRINHKQNLKA